MTNCHRLRLGAAGFPASYAGEIEMPTGNSPSQEKLVSGRRVSPRGWMKIWALLRRIADQVQFDLTAVNIGDGLAIEKGVFLGAEGDFLTAPFRYGFLGVELD